MGLFCMAELPTTGLTTAATAPNDFDSGIGVFAPPDEFAALSAALSRTSFSAITEAACGGRGAPSPGYHCAAAIVSDGLDRPLDLCAKLAKNCPTILLARNVSFEFQLAALRAGVEAVLSRPFDPNELIDWIEELTCQRNENPYSILVVEDDHLLAEVYARALRGAAMTVHVADTAAGAMQTLSDSLPDLVLMDVQMPGVNGIELARMIRQSRRYLSIPIMFLSAERNIEKQMEARRFGGDDFVAKPIDPFRLVHLVRLRAERARTIRAIMECDSLTGLLNHGRFNDRLARELARCRRTGSESCLAMIDLDHFKQVNDQHGHLIGDRVIRALANILTGLLRTTDIIGRCGGEEFGIILLDTPPHAARAVIDKARQRFCEVDFAAANGKFSSSFSAGIAGSIVHCGPEQIIAAADAALYAAKAGGRNLVMLDAAAGRPQHAIEAIRHAQATEWPR
jgi:diguanylate cyclase (GGDEF)-like protein